MADSLMVVVDSLVRHSLAVHGSLVVAKETRLDAFLETPLFKWGWPLLTGILAFFGARFFNQLDKKKDRAEKRRSAAEKAALFLAHAAKMFEALDIRLVREGAILLPRGTEYAPAKNVLEHLVTFDHMKDAIDDLGDNLLTKAIIDWHRLASSELNELIGYRTMIPGHYLATYAPGRPDQLEARFEALRAGLVASRDNAKRLAGILNGIAGKDRRARLAPATPRSRPRRPT